VNEPDRHTFGQTRFRTSVQRGLRQQQCGAPPERAT
jgi:hypothetical protein